MPRMVCLNDPRVVFCDLYVDRWAAGRDALVSYLRDLASDPAFAELVRQAGIDLPTAKEVQS